jgi:hypothetical protein
MVYSIPTGTALILKNAFERVVGDLLPVGDQFVDGGIAARPGKEFRSTGMRQRRERPMRHHLSADAETVTGVSSMPRASRRRCSTATNVI